MSQYLLETDKLIKRAEIYLSLSRHKFTNQLIQDLLTALKGKGEVRRDNIKKLMKYEHCGHHDEFWSECYSCNNPPTDSEEK
jgi:hypothetical protein